jgi:hypothetical protein
MRRFKFLMIAPIAVAAISMAGCVFLRSSSISEVHGKGAPVSASTSDLGFLHLIEPSNITDASAGKLVVGCPSGRVTDVQTELSVRDFLGIVQDYESDANGVCL